MGSKTRQKPINQKVRAELVRKVGQWIMELCPFLPAGEF